MNTVFNSYQYGISDEQLKENLLGFENVDVLILQGVYLSFSGHGHYKIKAYFEINGNDYTRTVTTTDMRLIDEWKEYMSDLFEENNNENDHETEEDLVNAMLNTINLDNDLVDEFIEEMKEENE